MIKHAETSGAEAIVVSMDVQQVSKKATPLTVEQSMTLLVLHSLEHNVCNFHFLFETLCHQTLFYLRRTV